MKILLKLYVILTYANHDEIAFLDDEWRFIKQNKHETRDIIPGVIMSVKAIGWTVPTNNLSKT